MQIKTIIFLIVIIITGYFLISFVFDPFDHVADYDAKASVAIGDALISANQSNMSMYWFDRAYADLPNDTDILKIRGDAYLRNGQLDQANQAFNEVLTSNSTDTVALQRTGMILTREGNYSGAVTYYDEVLAQNPNDANTLDLKGDALLLSSIAQQQAMQDYTQNISRDFGSGTSASAQSFDSLKMMDSYQEAVQSYNKAMEINPGLTIPITAKIMGATMNQVDEYQKVLNDLNS